MKRGKKKDVKDKRKKRKAGMKKVENKENSYE